MLSNSNLVPRFGERATRRTLLHETFAGCYAAATTFEDQQSGDGFVQHPADL